MMSIIAALSFDPAIIAGWLFAGLAAGWLAGRMTEEPSYGALGDLILGAVGGLAGGLLYGYFRDGSGFWDGTVVALVVGGIAIFCTRMVFAMRRE